MAQPEWLKGFVQESLQIEGIFREPSEQELEATWEFIQLDQIKVADLCFLVHTYQPDAVLRAFTAHRVWIGGREAPAGGMSLVSNLGELLEEVSTHLLSSEDIHGAHCDYEYLHPFTDGNGRSGRALWANLMFKQGYDFRYKFLQMFYYQTLSKFSKEMY